MPAPGLLECEEDRVPGGDRATPGVAKRGAVDVGSGA